MYGEGVPDGSQVTLALFGRLLTSSFDPVLTSFAGKVEMAVGLKSRYFNIKKIKISLDCNCEGFVISYMVVAYDIKNPLRGYPHSLRFRES